MSIEHNRLGTGWGGPRSGAGRKPRAKRWGKKPAVVSFPVYSDPDPSLLEPPGTLPALQRDVWRDWAPLALERRTLSAETAPGFAMLCELEVKRQALGLADDDRLYLLACKQVEGLMGRFCLAPFGKPVVSEKPKQAVNPFAALGGK